MEARTTVINITSGAPYDVYIGRQRSPKMWGGGYYLPRSPWHNPFRVAKDATHEEIALVLGKFERYLIEERPDLVTQLPDLRGKTLACWCKPGPCHGDALARLSEALEVEPAALAED